MEEVAPARKTNRFFSNRVFEFVNNLKQKALVWFVSLNVLEATFCVGVKTKRSTRNPPVCIREAPVQVCGVCPRRHNILGTTLRVSG